MTDLPLVPADLAEPKELIDAIRLRRGGSLMNLDRLLLNSPELAAGWNVFLGAVRQRLSLQAKHLELAICVVAILNKAEYEYLHHVPLWAAAGATKQQMDALRDVIASAHNEELFDPAERAIIQLSYEMTVNVAVVSASLSAVKRALSNDQMVVELAAVISTYNMVSRMIVVSNLPIEPG